MSGADPAGPVPISRSKRKVSSYRLRVALEVNRRGRLVEGNPRRRGRGLHGFRKVRHQKATSMMKIPSARPTARSPVRNSMPAQRSDHESRPGQQGDAGDVAGHAAKGGKDSVCVAADESDHGCRESGKPATHCQVFGGEKSSPRLRGPTRLRGFGRRAAPRRPAPPAGRSSRRSSRSRTSRRAAP